MYNYKNVLDEKCDLVMNDNCPNNEYFENACNNIHSIEHFNCNCSCGYDENSSVFPTNPMYGQSYVPFQQMDKTFIPSVGLKMGTIFPELVSPYKPLQSIEEIEFIRDTNTIGEGCNE